MPKKPTPRPPRAKSDSAASAPRAAIPRVPSGISGVDVITRGGFLQAGIYLIMGQPGTGKTILASQVCFNHVGRGGRAVFMTLLAESHARMLAHMQNLSFFDGDAVGEELHLFSVYQALEERGIKGLFETVRDVVRERHASLLVLDGLVTVGAIALSPLERKKFIHELQTLSELYGCTILLLTGASTGEENYAERTMVDGILYLHLESIGMRAERHVEVIKFRGSDVLLGKHVFEITGDGVVVHPRTEAYLGRSAAPVSDEPRAPMGFGIASFDRMLGGGPVAGSSTLLLGSPGTGKTLLGLSFLIAGARASERGLYFGFSETIEQLRGKASHAGLDLDDHLATRDLEAIWHPALELSGDALAQELFAAVERRKARRLFIDGIGQLKASIAWQERGSAFLIALTNELRSLGVTTICSEELPTVFGPQLDVPLTALAGIAENVIFLRHVELNARIRRLVSILKMGQGGHETSLREFAITDRGLQVASTFDSAESILSGLARSIATEKPKPKHPGARRRG